MSENLSSCPECGAEWRDGETCLDHFHLLLAWELDYQLYEVHHLLVLSYNLQHPSVYSPQTLEDSKRMLVEFVEGGITPQAMRKQIRAAVDSGSRKHKITGTPDSHGAYPDPVQWKTWVGDIVHGGIEAYYPNVRRWAADVLRILRESGNLAG